MRRAALIALLAVGASGSFATSAVAGTYVVRNCTPAHPNANAFGERLWDNGSVRRCDTTEPLLTTVGGSGGPYHDPSGAAFEACAPAGTTIRGFRVHATSAWQGSGFAWRIDSGPCDPGAFTPFAGGVLTGVGAAPGQTHAADGLAASGLRLITYCGIPPCAGGSASTAWSDVEITVDDPTRPVVANAGGGLWERAWVRGAQSIAFDGSDSAGVGGLQVDIDRRADGGAARRVPVGGECDASRMVPCATTRSLARSIDTTELTDGPHRLSLFAANSSGVWSVEEWRTVRVDNTAPELSLSGAGNPAVPHPRPVTVTIGARDAHAGMGGGGHVAFTLDGAPWTEVRGDEARVEIAGDGDHLLAYRAVDALGNRSPEQRRSIRIERGARADLGPGPGFSARSVNAATFTAAARFGPPCPDQVTLTASRDATVAEAAAAGASDRLAVGAGRESLVGFALPAAPDCAVEWARLRLYSAEGGGAIEVARASAAWDEQDVAWASRPGAVGATSSAAAASAPAWVEWDVAAQVQALYRYGDNGLVLRGTSTTGFCAREDTTAACAGRGPQLVVRFGR